jgi:hypothetical protein
MALETGLADGVLVTVVLGPGSGVGDVSGGHCEKVLCVKEWGARGAREL